jgi:hypothetical protein
MGAALVVVIPSLFGLGLVIAPTAQAEVYTCGTASNYFDGYYQPVTSYFFEGARADIVTRYGAVCDTNYTENNFTAEWSMIANPTGNGWAQSGYIRWYNGGIVYFAQQYDGAYDLVTKFGSSAPTGQTHLYTQWWDPSCICLHSDVDTSVYLVSSWNPFAVWSYPFSPQFFGEAAYLASDVAGNAASQTQFTSLGGEREDNDNWEGYPCRLLSAANDGSSRRADGESWHLVANATCPNFQNYTDTYG